MTGRQRDVDGGYAWVVLAGLFISDMLLGILWCSVGMLTTAIVDEIEDDITQASLVAATTLGSSTLLGPVSGLLHDRMGHRWTGLVSGVLMLIGLLSASFCTSVTGLICTFGLITGFGASLGMNLSGVVPGSYFKKKLSIAYGINQVGGGCGLFVAGPSTLFLLERYQLSGTLLILGAIMFHVTLVGALIRPNTVIEDEEKLVEPEVKSSDVCRGDIEETSVDSKYVKTVVETDVDHAQHHSDLADVDAEESHALLTEVELKSSVRGKEDVVYAEVVASKKSVTQEQHDRDGNHSNGSHLSMGSIDGRRDCSSELYVIATGNHDSPQAYRSEIAQEPLVKLPIAKEHTATKNSTKIMKLLKKALNVFTNNGFYIYLLSSVFWTLGESACMVHLPYFAKVKGSTPAQAATLLSGMGVTAIVGGLLAGLAASDPNIENMLLNFGFLGMCGIVTLLFPLYSYTYSLQMVFSTLYGLYSQAPWVMVGPICVQLVGIANMGFGYGLAAFSTGIGYLIGPPVASLLYESTGVYDYSYIFAGCCLLVSAFFIAIVPMFEKQRKEQHINPKSEDEKKM